jgi:hypothetical protein
VSGLFLDWIIYEQLCLLHIRSGALCCLACTLLSARSPNSACLSLHYDLPHVMSGLSCICVRRGRCTLHYSISSSTTGFYLTYCNTSPAFVHPNATTYATVPCPVTDTSFHSSENNPFLSFPLIASIDYPQLESIPINSGPSQPFSSSSRRITTSYLY